MEQNIIKFIKTLQDSDVYGYPPNENGKLLYDEITKPIILQGETLKKYHNYIDNKKCDIYEYTPLKFFDKKTKEKLSCDQEIAIQGAINNHFSIITGSAGTGKSKCILNIVESICELQGNCKRRILIGTPTGIAASRLRKCLNKISINVSTLHSLIGYRTKKVFDYNLKQQEERNLINYYSKKFDHFIIDEAGMVSYDLFYDVLYRYPEIKYITLVGDYNQLQPIKSASLFREIILSNTVPVYKLTTNHRLTIKDLNGNIMDNYILYNANNILNSFNFQLNDKDNFQLINNGTIDEICNVSACLRDDGINCEEVTVITPYKAPLVEFNSILRNLWNSKNMQSVPILDSWNKQWYIGDRVRMTVNNREFGIYNGDEGILTQWVYKSNNICGVYVKFFCQDERDKPLEFLFKAVDPKLGIHGSQKFNEEDVEKIVIEDETDDDYNNEMVTYHLTLSYALTIHSAQGAEYRYVIFYLPPTSTASDTFFNNSMLYTIITRAKEFCFCIGNILEMNRSINCSDKRNCTHTRQLLCNVLPKLENINLQAMDELCEYISPLDDDEDYSNYDIDHNSDLYCLD
jgi:exodeoxyribonuclease V alpha subunit